MNLEMVGKRTHDMAKVFHHQACFFNGDVLCACTITLIYHTINERKCLKSRKHYKRETLEESRRINSSSILRVVSSNLRHDKTTR